ncbi:MAG TPA: hypothetical protein VN256_22615 [Pyrinomonadaceae bacterium]|nr:hypothetical protein [Pyrinomonadaceae bacterium]
MSGYNNWIIRALVARLRQPGMRTQRRFVAATGLVLALFATGAAIYLFRQPTNDAMERAAIKVFAAMGVLILILIAAAVFIRKRTRASWSQEETLKMAGKSFEEERPKEGL